MVAIETPHDSFRKVFTHPFLQGCVLVVVALAIAMWIQVPDRFPDPDSFYHAGMAQLAAQGRFPQRFPWLELTTLKEQYADLHLVYHIALVPFVHFFGPMTGIRIATIAAVGLFTAAFYLLLRSLAIRGAFAFTLLLLGSSAFMFRADLAKSQGFAFIVLFLGLAALVRRSRTGVFLAAVFATWMSSHWPLFFIAVVVFAFHHVFATAIGAPRAGRTILLSIRESFGLLASAVFGVAAGFIVNPYFPENITVAWQQIVQIAFAGGRAGVNIGVEWTPLALRDFFGAVGFLLPPALLALLGTIVSAVQLVWREEVDDRDRVARSLTFGILAIAFAVLTIRSQRHIEFFVPLIIIFIALGLQPLIGWCWPPKIEIGWRRPGMIRRPIATFALLFLLVGLGFSAWRSLRSQRDYFLQGFQGDHLRSVAVWLHEHAPSGAIIYHAGWDEFPFLFLWNREQHYLVGLDPMFAYLANKERFLRWAAIGRGEVTDRVAQTIRNEFRAEYALVTSRQPALGELLGHDHDAKLVFEDKEARVYQLAP